MRATKILSRVYIAAVLILTALFVVSLLLCANSPAVAAAETDSAVGFSYLSVTSGAIAAIIAAAGVVVLGACILIAYMIAKRNEKPDRTKNIPPEKASPPRQPAAAADETAVRQSVEKAVPPSLDQKPAPTPQKPVEKASEQPPVAKPSAPEKEAVSTVDRTVEETGKPRLVTARYNRSFTAKVIQSDEKTKRYYSELKNHLLSYSGVKSKTSWKWETFRKGRKILAKLRLRGKTLSVCLALNADDYADTKFKVENVGEVRALAVTPCLYRIKNDRRLGYAKQLADILMQNDGIEKANLEQVDYAAAYPYETTDKLIAKKLIKLLKGNGAPTVDTAKPPAPKPMQSVTASDADVLMQDEVASALIIKSDAVSDRTKSGIVNIDTLSQCFSAGETVTLKEIKKRVTGFNKRVTCIKVLARGTLDKPLTVEADSFSLQAVKMIALTGGTAIKKK